MKNYLKDLLHLQKVIKEIWVLDLMKYLIGMELKII